MPTVTKTSLRKMLEDEEFHELDELVELPEKEVVPILSDLMAKDKDTLIRQRCAIALGYIGDENSAAALSDRLGDDSEPVVISAIRALAQLKAEAYVDQVTEQLKSKDASIRRYAAQALGVIAAPKSEKSLTDLLETEEEEFVRDSAADSLRELHRRASSPN